MDGHKGADQHRTNTNSSASSSNNSSTGNKGRGTSKTRGKDDSSDKSRKKEGNTGGGGGTKQRNNNSSGPSQSSGSHVAGNSGSSANGSVSSRYYYREVPPRFQNHKHQTKITTKSPHSKSTQGNKKTKDSSRWPSHSSADNANWTPSPDDESNQSIQSASNTTKGRGDMHGEMTTAGWESRHQELWSQNKHPDWTSDEDSLSNSDPMADELDEFSNGEGKSFDKKRQSQDPASDWEELDDFHPVGSADKSSESKHNKKESLEHGLPKDHQYVHSPTNVSPDGGPEIMSGDGIWRGHPSRSSIGSTSSVNSVGSNSSWKTASGTTRMGNFQRSTSPRKQGRYDSHRSVSVSSLGRSASRFSSSKTKKPVMDFDDAIESLHSEPSGWGDLPSPKPSNIDTGTEVWGIPDDVRIKMKKDHPAKPQNWGEPMSQGAEWGDNGTTAAGWSHTVGENGITEGMQWGSETSWNTVVSKGKDRGTFADKVKTLVDMGFPPLACEKALKVNNDNVEAAIGDLLALTALKDEESQDVPNSSLGYNPPSTSNNTANLLIRSKKLSSSGNSLPMSSSGQSSITGNISPPSTKPASSTSVTGVDPLYQQKPITGTTGGSGVASLPSQQPQQSLQNHLQSLNWQQPQQQQQQQRALPNTTSTTAQNNYAGLDLPNLQQVLTQQVNQFQYMKQQLVIQLSKLRSSSLSSAQLQNQQQFFTTNLNQVNTKINLVNQQLQVIKQLLAQQKSSSHTNIVYEKDGKEVGGVNSVVVTSGDGAHDLPSNSTTTVTSEVDSQSLSYGVQNLSLAPTPTSITQTSARTLSRLQQIISGSQQQTEMPSLSMEVKDETEMKPFSETSTMTTSLPIVGKTGDNTFLATSSQDMIISSTTTRPVSSSTFASSSRFNAVRSVDDIPEFKPGVPWHPHTQSNQSQVYTKSSSVSTPTTPHDFGGLYSNQSTHSDNNSKEFYSSQSSFGRPTGGFNSQYGHQNNVQYELSQHFNNPPHFSNAPIGGGSGYPFNRSSSYSGTNNYATPAQGGGHNYKLYGSQPKPPPPHLPGGGGTGVFPPGRHRIRLQNQHSFSGFPISSGSSSYGSIGRSYNRDNFRSQQPQFTGNNKGFEQPQQQHQKWNFDGNPWGMPTTSGSIWSMESSDSLLNSTDSTYTEWRGGSTRKPSLPLHLSAPTSYIVLKNVTSQIDEASLREVCSEYGKVLSCSMNHFNEAVLIQYGNKEEAALAKTGLEKNPVICGVYVTPCFATDLDIASFLDQRTPSNPSINLSSALNLTASSWLPDNQASLTSQQKVSKKDNASLWGTSGDTFPGSHGKSSSVWSNRGILPGINTPWNIAASTAQEKEELSTSPPLSTFLPNGLF